MVTLTLLLACAQPAPEPPLDTDESDVVPPDTDETDPPVDTGEPPPACGPGVMVFNGRTPYPDLQPALDAALDGDTLEICPGTWSGRWNKQLEGHLTLTSRTRSADDVVLSTIPYQRTLVVSGVAPHLTLSHLTLTHDPSGGYGTALQLAGDTVALQGSLTLDHCHVRDFPVGLDPLGREDEVIRATGLAEVTLRDSTFTALETEGTAPLVFQLIDRALTIERCAFEDNRGLSQGAMVASRVSWATTPWQVTITDSTFARNGAFSHAIGSAVALSHESTGPAVVHVERTSFFDNDANLAPYAEGDLAGGALFVGSVWRSGPLALTIVDSRFERNAASFAAHLRVLGHGEGEPWTAQITRTTFVEGAGTLPDVDPGECPNAGVHVTSGGQDLVVTLTDVDVGAGPTANACAAFLNCADPVEGVVSGVLNPAVDDWCP
jgi:hypothetical protein